MGGGTFEGDNHDHVNFALPPLSDVPFRTHMRWEKLCMWEEDIKDDIRDVVCAFVRLTTRPRNGKMKSNSEQWKSRTGNE